MASSSSVVVVCMHLPLAVPMCGNITDKQMPVHLALAYNTQYLFYAALLTEIAQIMLRQIQSNVLSIHVQTNFALARQI